MRPTLALLTVTTGLIGLRTAYLSAPGRGTAGVGPGVGVVGAVAGVGVDAAGATDADSTVAVASLADAAMLEVADLQADAAMSVTVLQATDTPVAASMAEQRMAAASTVVAVVSTAEEAGTEAADTAKL